MTTKQARDMFVAAGAFFSPAEDRALAREDLIYNATEDLLVLMEQQGISKTELARRLGRSKSYVTQLLSGARNMTLGTLSDICFGLGAAPRITLLGDDIVGEYADAQWEEVPEDSGAPPCQVLSNRNVIDCKELFHWMSEVA